MTKVTALLASVADLLDEEGIAQKELDRVQDLVQQETGRLRAELAAGGTTNDPLHDLVLKAGYGVNDPSLTFYRGLQTRLKGRNGQFVMVRYPAEVRERCGGTLDESDMRHEEHFRLGILAGEELRLGNSIAGTPLITLPVDRYMHGAWPGSHSLVVTFKDEAPQTPFRGDFLELRSEGDPARLLEYLQNEHLVPNLVVGDEAFRAELKGVDCESFLFEAADALGRLLLQPSSAAG
ncbi:MAG: hypothetical protein AAB919_00370 [Patescibacteria group bacterium]